MTIEIDGLLIENGGSFHGNVSHNQMVNDDTWSSHGRSMVWPKLSAQFPLEMHGSWGCGMPM
jgi:hypothetical protein